MTDLLLLTPSLPLDSLFLPLSLPDTVHVSDHWIKTLFLPLGPCCLDCVLGLSLVFWSHGPDLCLPTRLTNQACPFAQSQILSAHKSQSHFMDLSNSTKQLQKCAPAWGPNIPPASCFKLNTLTCSVFGCSSESKTQTCQRMGIPKCFYLSHKSDDDAGYCEYQHFVMVMPKIKYWEYIYVLWGHYLNDNWCKF